MDIDDPLGTLCMSITFTSGSCLEATVLTGKLTGFVVDWLPCHLDKGGVSYDSGLSGIVAGISWHKVDIFPLTQKKEEKKQMHLPHASSRMKDCAKYHTQRLSK